MRRIFTLPLTLFFFTLCLIASSAFYVARERSNLKATKLNELASILDLKVNQITEWRRERLSDAYYIFNNQRIAENFAGMMKRPGDSFYKTQTLSWLNALFKNGNYRTIGLFDSHGALKLSANGIISGPLREEHRRAAQSAKDIYFSDFYVSSRGEPALAIIVPIFDPSAARRRIFGFARLEINPRLRFYPLLQSWVTLSNSAEIILVRVEGDSIVYLNDLVYLPSSALSLKMAKTDTTLAGVKAALGFVGGFEAIDYRGRRVFASARTVPGTGWHIVVKQDTDEVFAQMHRNMLISSGAGVIILALMGILIRFAYHRQKKEAIEIRNRLEQERKYRAIFESMPVSLWEADWSNIIGAVDTFKKQGVRDFRAHFDNDHDFVVREFKKIRILDVNHATVTLFDAADKQEFLKSFDRIFTRESFVRFEEALGALANGEPLYAAELRLSTLKGSLLHVVFTMTFPPPGSDSTIVLYSLYDITEKKRNEEKLLASQRELERAYKELEAFSYSVSHDLRAPLRAIGGFTRMIAEDCGASLPAEANRYFTMIRENVDTMGELIDDLLAFSRATRTTLSTTPIPMNDLVEKAIKGALTAEQRARVNFRIGNLDECVADPAMIMQVWINLISNAVKFSSKNEEPIITIESQQKDSSVVYTIRDNGAGFDMKYASKLFGVFQRLHSASEFPGTGVGLAIVERIVAKHNGKIWAESSPGAGAAFHVELPLREV